MRIKRILLQNYRQFRNVELSFNENPQRDLHAIIGVMGTGKTNILNAINWCLYGDEPHLSKDSQQLPRLNLKTIEEAEEVVEQKVIVDIWTEANGDIMGFRREENYSVYDKKQQPRPLGTNFKAMVGDAKGNVEMVPEEDVGPYVERFVPKGIREFFFFDGERLDNYFRSATGQQISHATFQISQVSILEDVEDKLQKVIGDLRKDAGKQSPGVEDIREELERRESNLSDIESQIRECEKQIGIAKEEAAERRRNLSGIPNVAILQEEIDELERRYNEKRNACRDKETEKQNLLFEYGKSIMLRPTIEKSLQIIREKRDMKELPPTIDKVLIDNILAARKCICGRTIDPKSEEERQLSQLLEGIKVSSDIAQALLSMEIPLYSFKERIEQFKTDIQRITEEIERYKYDLEDILARKRKLDDQIGGYDTDKIREWHIELSNYEKMHSDNLERVGILKLRREELKNEKADFEVKLKNELKKGERLKKLRKSINFGTKALGVVREAKTGILEGIRKQIEAETRRSFFNLMWKKETFKDVTIDEDYAIHLVHSFGYDCLGTISGGEREVLALSFTVALHGISGFDCPILIDRPLAMVSGRPRKYIIETLSKISTKKQIILLLTPDDYLGDVGRLLDEQAIDRFKLKLSSDEREANMEVL